jgi:hypothetical protein
MPNKAPIIICGCPGGGTSYTTRLLRYCGFSAGLDSGDLRDRKFHESLFFKNINKEILTKNKIPKIIWDTKDLPRAEAVFSSDKTVENIYKNIFLKNKDSFKSNIASSYGSPAEGEVWGWKDPRNSITLPFWLKVFPEAKVLFIKKTPKEGAVGKSKSGIAFLSSDEKLREFYFMPPYFNKNIDHLSVNFEEIVGNHKDFNNLLRWMELETLDHEGFRNLLETSKFEGL